MRSSINSLRQSTIEDRAVANRGFSWRKEADSLELLCMNPINNPSQFTALLSMFVTQLPILLVSLLGCVLVMARRNELSAAAPWVLMGFGLSVVLCVLIPMGQMLAQNWAMQGSGSITQRASVFTVLAFVWSLLRAASYGLLLMAILTGRLMPRAATQNRG